MIAKVRDFDSRFEGARCDRAIALLGRPTGRHGCAPEAKRGSAGRLVCRRAHFARWRCVLGTFLLLWVVSFAKPGGAVDSAAVDWGESSQWAVQALSEYLRIDTQNPPGRTVEAAAVLERWLGDAGLEVERVDARPGKPIVLGRLRGEGSSAEPLILLSHMDVVGAEAARWTVPPLAGEVRDDQIWGRGAIDMKGFAIVQLAALRALAQRKTRPRHDIVFLAVPDEEVGGRDGMQWLAENRPDLLRATAVWGEGGMGVTDAFAVPALFVAVAEKQVLWVRLVAEGPSGHGARPLPDAAPRRLQEALGRVFAEPPPPRLTPLVQEMFARLGAGIGGVEGFAMRRIKNPLVWLFADGVLQQSPLASVLVRDTIALTVLQAGNKPNVIPPRAQAVLDCRLLPDTEQEEFLKALHKTIDDPTIRIEIVQGAEPARPSPTDDPLFEAISRAARGVYPQATFTPFLSAIGTDLRFFRRRGIPAYGFMPFLLEMESYNTMHGVDERLPVGSLEPAIRVVYDALGSM